MGRPKGGMNRVWTYEERLRVVLCYFNEHMSVDELSELENVPRGTIVGWIKRYEIDGKAGLINKRKTGNALAALHTSKSLTEVERLKLELLQKDIEIMRLKKGYQVKGAGANKVYVTLNGKIIK